MYYVILVFQTTFNNWIGKGANKLATENSRFFDWHQFNIKKRRDFKTLLSHCNTILHSMTGIADVGREDDDERSGGIWDESYTKKTSLQFWPNIIAICKKN